MKAIQKKTIFTEIADEEASTVSGGGPLNYLIYMLLAQTPASPGGTTITSGEIQHGWNILINAALPVNGVASSSRKRKRKFLWW
ncbi:hypothetical protein WA1_09335 [Scytonema hofmannii PCC 7110]|uniref:Uncharacterized protein n=1 Tax=Scytonema hofmannii PCC 7110 TaxID=128403 RepID=A0A139WSC8_9CYAN|nr:hypothetical protein [Scytonema hofmannii]KYC35338.1 hypothetical protein WA1_09335 [Scytonema hofmannii PCC 7110]